MILEMASSALKENTWYSGIVTNYALSKDNSKLIIYVVFNKEPDIEYIKSIYISNNPNSPLGILAARLGIYNDDGNIDTELLKGLSVKATLKKAPNDILYINKLKLND